MKKPFSRLFSDVWTFFFFLRQKMTQKMKWFPVLEFIDWITTWRPGDRGGRIRRLCGGKHSQWGAIWREQNVSRNASCSSASSGEDFRFCFSPRGRLHIREGTSILKKGIFSTTRPLKYFPEDIHDRHRRNTLKNRLLEDICISLLQISSKTCGKNVLAFGPFIARCMKTA